jgi:allophanate hydrolase
LKREIYRLVLTIGTIAALLCAFLYASLDAHFMTALPNALTIDFLLDAYRSGALKPSALIQAVVERIKAAGADPALWITNTGIDTLQQKAALLDAALNDDPVAALRRYPMLGIPFAVKDNIDVAGLPTTAACPDFSHAPGESAAAVARLEAAGAIVVGKTNMDQFATGLVGTRSPYGAVRNPFNADYVSGGSSSGSAAVTALGLVAFALGTDTAGSGRVPAAFCNLVGLKPTPGLVSNRGVVPACRSLDCVSVFSHTVSDAWQVLSVIAGNDDIYIRPTLPLGLLTRGLVIGVPDDADALGDVAARKAFAQALDIVKRQPGVTIQRVDLLPFQQVAALLYEGPWVAERRASLGTFFDTHRHAIDPTVAAVIARADQYSAADAFIGQYRLAELRPICEALFDRIDVLLLPTTPTIYTLQQIAQSPIERNADLGRYTNFVNLLGLSALAMPAPFRDDGLPAGITLVGKGGADHCLAEIARRWETDLHTRLGTTDELPPRCSSPLPPLPSFEPSVELAVVGAHLSGLPLNWQLLERGAILREVTVTAPLYRLYALPGTTPPKPGLIQVPADGHAIATEVWEMSLRHFGSFVAEVPPPLGIGTVTLASGRKVKGFICEGYAVNAAEDVSGSGGWRAYLAGRRSSAAPIY